MKTLLLLLCVAGATLASCSQEKSSTPLEQAADLPAGTTVKGADGSKIKKQADGDIKYKDADGNVVKKDADDGTVKAKSAD
ncbi:hypothetical protein [Hymenobacter sp. GOD-10R]|uniref:hypothetical protein n=1 Tax=Hymenobacter sp. GOD-10R TaxID=3093922 RepID=UPI002D78C1AF|nr:hypothetical protein [Hymenobacter sp. GOD-10R]WRQ26353.1 hypothetical protein SD425_14825 [Hymenobacter sp. GOD-10R]